MSVPPTPTQPRQTVILVVSVLAAASSIVVLFVFDPARHGFYPGCVFYRLTGLLCPACGSLRALHHLLHGEIATAFRFNALLICVLPLAGWFFASRGLARLRGCPARPQFKVSWFLLGLAVAVIFGVWRNLAIAPHDWLR